MTLAGLFGLGDIEAQATKVSNANEIQYLPGFDKEALQASLKAANEWLGIVDGGNYGVSWDQGATIFKLTMPRDEWNTYLDKVRKPSGSVVNRDIVDQRVSKDPKGLPKGDYMVVIYSTKFSNGKSANELITLQNEQGKWKVMGYYIKENSEK
jgi:hypothetical protein